ncbi:MAG: hypothetical protein IT186_19775 [Acidobacteria bacterium]|nr:hypothetical protein [Acidobacteriota bacterium]MCG3193508.1 hypothetical protein [Thermoanaerobaculia bacterium]MCK6681569.1 hypothetical protein [Thermoanaerobaculia bacterium]
MFVDRTRFVTPAVVLLGSLLMAGAAMGESPRSLAESTELWGGPAARGAGQAGARFDSIIYITGSVAASGVVEFYQGGQMAASTPFSTVPRGVTQLSTPAALDGKGTYLFKVRADQPVSAWSETYNDSPNGRYSVSLGTFRSSDFLDPGDEANGGGAAAHTTAGDGKARTNVVLLCSPAASQNCVADVSAYESGRLIGTGRLETVAGSAAQNSLASLIPGAAEKSGLSIRFAILSGPAQPTIVRNDNENSDGTIVFLTVTRSAFSTAPVINSFTADPAVGCAPQEVTLTWSTTGAVRVNISGVASDLPASGSYKLAVNKTTEFLLRAFAASGESSTRPVTANVQPATPVPAPQPSSETVNPGGEVRGYLPSGLPNVTWEFAQQQSQGSKFVIDSNNYFTYTAGTTLGKDIIRLTVNGPCGPATALFTAVVQEPGEPAILEFYAERALPGNPLNRACVQPPENQDDLVLHWRTQNVRIVTITNTDPIAPLPVTGQWSITVTDPITYTLTAVGIDGTTKKQDLNVIVDRGPVYTTITPTTADVVSGTTVMIQATLTPSSAPLTGVGWYFRENQTRAGFELTNTPGLFRYIAGPDAGRDWIQFGFRNACGISFTDFRSNVSPINNPPK